MNGDVKRHFSATGNWKKKNGRRRKKMKKFPLIFLLSAGSQTSDTFRKHLVSHLKEKRAAFDFDRSHFRDFNFNLKVICPYILHNMLL